MDSMILHKWFHKNHIVLYPGKSHYSLIVTKLNFDSHITSLCKKT